MIDRQRTESSGFTLIEMLVVISIIVILAAVSLPALGRMITGTASVHALRAIEGAINSAHAKAITDRTNYYIDVDYDVDPVILRVLQGDINGKIVEEVLLPEGVTLTGYRTGGQPSVNVDLKIYPNKTLQIVDAASPHIPQLPIRPHEFKDQNTILDDGDDLWVFMVEDSNDNAIAINYQHLTSASQSLKLD